MRTAAFYLTCASAVSVLFSIAVSQILLGLALVALLVADVRLRLPPIWLPIALFMGGTLLSLALSPDPMQGVDQVRKFFVFSMLLVCYCTVREVADWRRLMQAWMVVGALVAARGLIQFQEKLQASREAGLDFYQSYIGQRITGFMGHWMTFGSIQMYVLLMLLAFLAFSPAARRRLWIWLLCGGLLAAALLLGFTRSIWLAAAAGLAYLAWHWDRRALAVLPVLGILGFVLAPASLRSRAVSILEPQAADSNLHRVVTWRTGIEMIQAHPLLGVGPEFVRIDFDRYVPADIPRPLPHGWYGHLHNLYLHYAAERGIPTMLTLLWLLGRILYDAVRALRRLPPGRGEARFLLHGGVACVLATLVVGIFELNLGDSEVLTMFLVITAAAYAAAEAPEAQHA